MQSIILRNRSTTNSTIIPNIFIDKYMPEANGEFVKIYLYLLRCISDAQLEVTISLLADKFNHTENDVIRALKYWDKQGLIELGFNQTGTSLTTISVLDVNEYNSSSQESASSNMNNPLADNSMAAARDYYALEQPVPNEEVPVIVDAMPAHQSKPVYSAAQIKEFSEKEELSQLLYIAQKYLGKTLTSTETNSIIYFYETLKFPSDLIEYLIEYCVSREHTSMRYIEKVALSWADAGIMTVSQAKEESSAYSKNTFSIMKAFGINGRNPGKREMDYINKWNDIYCFNSEMIIEACNRTLQATHQPSFEYADSILNKWREKNITRLSELKELDDEFAKAKLAKKNRTASRPNKTAAQPSNRFNNFNQRSYDYDALEKQLLGNNSLKNRS